jgi:hypothetical protein
MSSTVSVVEFTVVVVPLTVRLPVTVISELNVVGEATVILLSD